MTRRFSCFAPVVVLLTTMAAPAFAQLAAPTPVPVPPAPSLEAPAPAPTAPAAPPPLAPAPAGSVGGMGDVNLYPKRVVLTERNRVASIGLFNRARGTGEYDVAVADMAMTPEGQLVAITDPAQAGAVKGAGGFVRWSPHHVSLPGNESQMVRVMARIPPDLPPGEYRTHFSVTSVPEGLDGPSIEDAVGAPRASGIGVRIVPRFGIAIPIIVRVGETTLTVGLRDLAVTTNAAGAKVVRVTITREGTRSAFGDITITAPGAKQPVALLKGLGVYPEISQRTVEIPIDPAVDRRLYAPGSKLTVIYVDDDFAPGRTLAKQELDVP
jgi:hypothetical protein